MKTVYKFTIVFICTLWAILLFFDASAKQQAPSYTVAPTPDWVVQQSYNPDGFKNVKYGNAPYLLYTEQTVYDNDDLKNYTREARRVDNLEGAESVSQIAINFDPSYQNLIIHNMKVTRDGKTSERLKKDIFKLYRVETDADRLIYNGTVTASTVLEDIRVGDIVEYAYTVTGRNNFFKGNISTFQRLQYGVPIDRHYISLSVPNDREYKTRLYAGATAPKISRSGKRKTFVWAFDQQNKLDVDESSPSWFVDYPYFQISDKTDWAAVGRWKANLYGPAKKVSPELNAVIQKIKTENPVKDGQITAVLKFVQSEIRYLGIEIGEGGYVPRDPSKVYARRFGDCKDKTRLMVTMLDQMGIEATPVLVHTDERDGIDKYLPNISVFDHVITSVKLRGETYFLDPTKSEQSGSLYTLEQPYYGKGVLVSPTSTGLIDIDPPSGIEFNQDTIETFGIGSSTKTITLYVETKLYGDEADSFLRWNASQGIEAIQKSYLEHYQKTYPTIEVMKPIEYKTDADNALVEITEQYMIPKAWQQDDDEKPNYNMVFDAEPTSIADSIPEVNKRPRTSPLAIAHKVRIRHKLEFNLPDDWSLDTSSLKIDNASFNYSKSRNYKGNTYTETYIYKSKKDHISPDELQEVMKDIEKLDADWGVRFESGDQYYEGKPSSSLTEILDLFKILGGLLLLLGGIYFTAVRLTRKY